MEGKFLDSRTGGGINKQFPDLLAVCSRTPLLTGLKEVKKTATTGG